MHPPPPHHPGLIFHHDEMCARKWPLPLCVLFGNSINLASEYQPRCRVYINLAAEYEPRYRVSTSLQYQPGCRVATSLLYQPHGGGINLAYSGINFAANGFKLYEDLKIYNNQNCSKRCCITRYRLCSFF